MTLSEIIVEKGDMAADPQAVGDDAELGGIAEMTVDILLAGVRVGPGCLGQEGVNGLVRIEIRVGFCELFRLPELGVEELGVVLGDGELDAGGVIDEVIGFLRVNLTTDGLGQVYKMLKHLCEVRLVVLPEPRELGGVRHLVKAAEIPKLGAQAQYG